MFTVKATYGNETRKFTFPDSVLFPTYNEIVHQLCRLFPISHNYYLSRLIFSPDASKPGRILIGKEVHSAEDYDSHIAPLRRLWPNPLLRFTVFDETNPQTAPSVASERLSLYSNSTIPSSDVTFKLSPPVGPCQGCESQLSTSPPTLPFKLPPPPVTLFPISAEPRPLPIEREAGNPSACCSITKGKADLETMLSSFKQDLEHILSTALGTGQIVQQSTLPVTEVSGINVVSPQTEGPIDTNPIKTRWCFVCRTSFTGVWYGCIKCPWHAVCPGCFSKSHSAHTLSFGPSHVVQQRSVDQVSARGTGSNLHSSVLEDSPSPKAAPSGPARSVHVGVTCDGCNETVVGVRHKCLDCPDYDLCTACMESGGSEKHNPFHEFFSIEIPGRVFVHTVLGRDVDGFLGNRQQAPGFDRAQPTQEGSPSPVHPPVHHSATCNLCDSGIVGERYKCLVCPDFDTCSSCFRITIEQHPSHGFVRVNEPKDLMMRDLISRPRAAHPAHCDACHQTIRGIRYKCMHPSCPDFDLCNDCEALPIPVHPLNHPMLKLRTADTVIPTVYRVGQARTVPEPFNRQATPVAKESPVTLLLNPLAPRAKPPNAPSAVVSGRDINTAAEGQIPFAEEFLSPLGSPTSDALGEAPPSTPSRPVNVTKPPESPWSGHLPYDISHRRWPSVYQESMHSNTVQNLKARSLVDVTEAGVSVPVACETLVTEEPLLATSGMYPISPISRTTKSIFDRYRTPSPVLSSVQELQGATQLPTDNRQEIAKTEAPQQSHLDSAFVGDANVPDGQVFPPGAEFVKGWHIMNNGGLRWPATTEVRFVAGEMFAPEYSASLGAKVGAVYPGQNLDIWTGDLKAPDVPGRYVGYWRLNDGQGNFFGNSMWIDLIVADHHSDQASEHSLAASSMVMPSAHPVNSVNASEELERALQPSLPSTGTAMDVDGVADPESDVSSVSLVSMPSSDDEDAEWQDTRTHSEPLEYVVLYDSNSEEE